MVSIVAIDPGQTTGWVLLHEDYDIESGHMGPDEHHLALWELLDHATPDYVVYETFVYQNRPDAMTLDLSAREYIGVVKLWGLAAGVPTIPSIMATAKNLWKNQKLTRLRSCGVFVPTNKHEKDALRHALTHLSVNLKNHYFEHLLRESGGPKLTVVD